MSTAVFNEAIGQYAKNPDYYEASLVHYGVKGMHWGQHQQGKWQNHAVYAIGDRRHTDGTPMYGSKLDNKLKSIIEDKLISKSGNTPRKDFNELSTEELINRTNRLSKENAYMQEMQKANRLDKDFIDATKKTGLLEKSINKIYDTTTNFTKNASRAMMYKSIENALGEDVAKMIVFDQAPGGDKKKKEEKKSNQQQGNSNTNNQKKQIRSLDDIDYSKSEAEVMKDVDRLSEMNRRKAKAAARMKSKSAEWDENGVRKPKGTQDNTNAEETKEPEPKAKTSSRSEDSNDDEQYYDWDYLYNSIDTDHSGSLEREEFQKAFNKAANSPLPSYPSSSDYYMFLQTLDAWNDDLPY